MPVTSMPMFWMVRMAVSRPEPGPFTFTDENPYLADEVLRHKHRPGFRGHWEGTWFEINSLGMRGPGHHKRRGETGGRDGLQEIAPGAAMSVSIIHDLDLSPWFDWPVPSI